MRKLLGILSVASLSLVSCNNGAYDANPDTDLSSIPTVESDGFAKQGQLYLKIDGQEITMPGRFQYLEPIDDKQYMKVYGYKDMPENNILNINMVIEAKKGSYDLTVLPYELVATYYREGEAQPDSVFVTGDGLGISNGGAALLDYQLKARAVGTFSAKMFNRFGAYRNEMSITEGSFRAEYEPKK